MCIFKAAMPSCITFTVVSWRKHVQRPFTCLFVEARPTTQMQLVHMKRETLLTILPWKTQNKQNHFCILVDFRIWYSFLRALQCHVTKERLLGNCVFYSWHDTHVFKENLKKKKKTSNQICWFSGQHSTVLCWMPMCFSFQNFILTTTGSFRVSSPPLASSNSQCIGEMFFYAFEMTEKPCINYAIQIWNCK